jgi:hypothetical protein
MSNKSTATVATMGIDIGKNSFHVVGLDERGAIVLRQKWSRALAIALANKLARIAWAVLRKEREFECMRTRAMASRPA